MCRSGHPPARGFAGRSPDPRAIAGAGGYLLMRWNASLDLNFFAVSAGMMAFGFIPLSSLIRRVGFEAGDTPSKRTR